MAVITRKKYVNYGKNGEYTDYLHSKDFERLREICNRPGVPCYICQKQKCYKEPHHVSYERLGQERVGLDVFPLCHKCHQKCHWILWIFRVNMDRRTLTRRLFFLRALKALKTLSPGRFYNSLSRYFYDS